MGAALAAVGTGIASITAGIGGAVTTGAIAVGVGVETAAAIGAIAGPALFGAGIGAVGSAITGGNPLVGALTGGLTGGLGAVGAGSALGGALGIGTGAGNAVVGAGVGALGASLSGGNPLLGAVTGGAGGYLSGSGGPTGALNDLFGSSSTPGDALAASGSATPVQGTQGALNQASAPLDMADNSTLNPQSQFTGASTSTTTPTDYGDNRPWLDRMLHPTSMVNADGSVVTPPVPPMLDASGNPMYDSGGNLLYPDQATANTATQQAAEAAKGYASTPSGQAALGTDSGGGILSLLTKNPSLALGALSGLSSLFNKPQQGTYATPGPASVAGNLGPYFNAPLQPLNGQYPGRTAVTPTVPNYYTYGAMPGGAKFFQNNNLAAYGFARGGALNQAANENEYQTTNDGTNRVDGPGTGTSDSIPAALSDGEYVLTSKEVSQAGRGSNDRGAKKIDRLRKTGALSQMIARAS